LPSATPAIFTIASPIVQYIVRTILKDRKLRLQLLDSTRRFPAFFSIYSTALIY
jgi:hypothetical protein